MGRIGPVTVKYILALNTLGKYKWLSHQIVSNQYLFVDITLWKMIKKKLTIIGEAIGKMRTIAYIRICIADFYWYT